MKAIPCDDLPPGLIISPRQADNFPMVQLDKQRQHDYFSKQGGVSTWWKPEDGVYRAHYRRQFQALESLTQVQPGWRVLDLGTGGGRFARYYARRGAQVTAVDLNNEMLAQAQARARADGVADHIDFQQGEVETWLSDCREKFQLVSIMELMDHLADPSRVLALAKQVLAPGGTLLLTYVSAASLYGRLFSMVMRRSQGEDLHIAKTYAPGEVEAMLGEEGFSFRNAGVGLSAIILRETLLPSLQPLLAVPVAVEGALWPVVKTPALARRCTHVLVAATPS